MLTNTTDTTDATDATDATGTTDATDDTDTTDATNARDGWRLGLWQPRTPTDNPYTVSIDRVLAWHMGTIPML